MQSSLTSDPWIARLIGDRQRYRLEKRLGAGGMGDVFLAMDTLLGQQVALKLLKDTLVASEELRKRFEREVALCAALKSDHIVQVNDYGVTPEGYPFYVMEYLQGQTLGQLLKQQQQIGVERTMGIITQVCEGLRLAHRGVTLWRDGATASEHVKVVHRDLKPDNIFLVRTALGELVKLLDFGIAKIYNDGTEHTALTNMFLGTFHYAAPEQLEVEKDIDGRADIYSLGIILYEMLSGTDPFGFGLNIRSISGVSWALAHTSKPPVPLRSRLGSEHLSPELEAVVMRCLQKLPDERFASIEELQQALLAAVAVPQPLAPIPSQSQPPTPNVTEDPQGQNYPLPTQSSSLPPLSTPSSRQRSISTRFSRKSTLPLVGVGAVIAITVTVVAYYWLKSQTTTTVTTRDVGNSSPQAQVKDPETLNQSHLEQAKKLAAETKFKEAMTAASTIPKTSSFYSTAQRQIAQWSDSILKLATAQFQAGKLDAAIAQAQAIPATSPAYQKAQAAIVQWKKNWQVAETQFNTAQTALNTDKWQVAIDAANKVPDISFWQKKTKPIIQKAQSQIAKLEVQPTYAPPLQTLPRVSPEPAPDRQPPKVSAYNQPRQLPQPPGPASPPRQAPPARPTPVHPSGGGWENDSPPKRKWEKSHL